MFAVIPSLSAALCCRCYKLFPLAELTPVSSVSVDYSCTARSVLVQWSPVFGADSYKATALSDSGAQLTCSSTSTSCEISGLSCGQTFVVHVTPMSDNCRNMVNTTSATFHTGEHWTCRHGDTSSMAESRSMSHSSPHV